MATLLRALGVLSVVAVHYLLLPSRGTDAWSELEV